MALRPATQTQTDAPAFEPAVIDQPSATVDQPAVASSPAAAPVTVVKPSLPIMGGAFKAALSDKQEVLTLEDVEAIGFGTFPRITADLGGLVMEKVEIGKSLTMQVISWNIRYLATTNDNATEAKELVRTSYDNKTTTQGEDLAAYIESLKARGYEKASVKTYGDVWGMMTSNEKEGVLAEDKMVNLSLSPESLKQFKRYQLEQGIKEGRSGVKSDRITVSSERREFKGNRYGVMLFSAG